MAVLVLPAFRTGSLFSEKLDIDQVTRTVEPDISAVREVSRSDGTRSTILVWKAFLVKYSLLPLEE